MKKRIILFFSVLLISSVLTGCTGNRFRSLDPSVAGEITIMLWSGDGTFMEDVGRREFAPEDLRGQNNAAAVAVARAFNQIYPNVKVNVFAKSGGPNDNGVSWQQELENFKSEFGRYPDIWASTDLVGDISRGLVANLAQFSDDPLYKTFNPSVMNMMNYYGFQGGLPQFLQPWGVYINRALADDNNIDVPKPTWTIEEYTRFINSADGVNFWGAMDTEFDFIRTGSTKFDQMMTNFDGSGQFLDVNSDEIRTLIDFIPRWARSSIWPLQNQGLIPTAVMDENWWWSFRFFAQNRLLTNGGDPWMMGDCAHPDPTHWGVCQSSDWDIFPRPSTPFQPNTVGVVLDPLVLFNHCMLDGNQECTEVENAQTKLAYTFSAFWAGDTRAWQARLDQKFLDGEVLKTSLNSSFPLVTGPEFNKQMDIWFASPIHQRFSDTNRMPGFHEILRIWEAGQFWSVSDKTYTWTHNFEGASRPILYEWLNIWNPEVAGASRTDANWADNVKARLADWNNSFNSRFVEARAGLRQGLIQFYGFSESDFQ